MNKPNNRLNILEIIGTATRGGMENFIINFLKNLPADHFKITCICPCESLFTKVLRQLGVDGVYITPLADDPEWRSIQMAIEVCRLHNIDILHAHMPKSHVLAGIAGSLAHKPVVATVHGMHVTAHELGVSLAVKSHLITNCLETYIQAVTLGVPAERVSLFHNGVDTQVFTPGRSGMRLRELINVGADSRLVGFVGRLEYEKGPDLFVRAAGHVHEILPDVHFVMVGAGSMRTELEKISRQIQLDRYLHFIDWCENTSQVYPAFDLMVHTSRSDGTSLVLLEAMACGLPAVGMAVGGIKEIIENENTGMLTQPNDWHGTACEIIRLLSQPDLLKSMGQKGRKRVEENFNVLTNTRNTMELLTSVELSSQKEQKSRNDHSLFHKEIPTMS